jgi:hypothetical protein
MSLKIFKVQNGYSIYNENIFSLNKITANNLFDKDFKEKKYKTKIPSLSKIDNQDVSNEIYLKIIENIYDCLETDLKTKIKFSNLWLQLSEEKNYDSFKLPFIPHIDYRRCFKVMIYLNNIKKENGPIHLITENPDKFENKRKSLKKDYKSRQENAVNDFDVKLYEACTGDFGTAIFFDTNCPHFAGKITSGYRKILRFNFHYI